jgi:hypothetical protein
VSSWPETVAHLQRAAPNALRLFALLGAALVGMYVADVATRRTR